MDQSIIKGEIRALMERANPDAKIINDEVDLFEPSCRVAPRDMLFVCMELKKKYPIDYKQVVDAVKVYSLNNLAQAICRQIS